MAQLDLFRFLNPFAPRKARPAPRPARSLREPYLLEAGGETARVQRKPMCSLRMTLKGPQGELHVSAPLRAPDKAIREFIVKQLGWIQAQRQKLASQAPKAERQYLDGEALPFLGRTLSLRWEQAGSLAKAKLDGQTLLLRAPAGASRAKREAAVDRLFARELLAAATALLPEKEAALGVKAEGLKIRAMRSRWGSCNTRSRRITLALELARHPPECLETILVHELIHLIVRSHGPRFKGLMDKHAPQWRSIRKALNSRGMMD